MVKRLGLTLRATQTIKENGNRKREKGEGRGGAHCALEHWYVTLQPKSVISEPKGPKIIQFDTQNHHRRFSSTNLRFFF